MAAPWAQEEGDWYARALITQEELNGADANRVELYGEYGLAGRWTVTAKSEAVAYRDAPEFDRETWRVTMRHEFVSSGRWAMAVEAGAVHGSVVAGVFDCRDWGFEARLSGGYSGQRKGRPYYLFADLATIQHEDGCRRDKAELGYGADIGEGLFVTQQLWIERGNQTADSVKYETQIGYHFPWADVSAGYREELGNEFEEQAFLLALTLRR